MAIFLASLSSADISHLSGMLYYSLHRRNIEYIPK